MKFHDKFLKINVLTLILTLALAACSPAGDVEPDVESAPNLEGTSWTLVQFGPESAETAVLPDATITLNFNDGGISGSAGCNSYSADVTIGEDSLSIGLMTTTLMACQNEAVMQQESDYLAALGSVSSFILEADQLTLPYDNGRLIFTAGPADAANDEADDAADEEAEAVVKTWFVGPERVDCVGVAPQQCLQVREREDAEWTLFYGQIIGFDYEPGYEYELRVTETEVENPPADASSLEVSLVDVVSQTAVDPSTESRPEGSALQGTSWTLVSFGPDDNQTAVLPDSELTLNFDGQQINGSAGCNSYFADVTIEEDGTLSVGLVGSTLMACLEEDVMQQESEFLAMLAEATSYTRSGNRLMLHTENGSLQFVAATMHETDTEGAEVVDWETAVSILESGEVVEIFQTHSLDVTLTLADGRVIKTVEPAIDDIFTAVDECGEPCRDIVLATE